MLGRRSGVGAPTGSARRSTAYHPSCTKLRTSSDASTPPSPVPRVTARRGAGAPCSGGGRGLGPPTGSARQDGPAWGRGPHARERWGWGPNRVCMDGPAWGRGPPCSGGGRGWGPPTGSANIGAGGGRGPCSEGGRELGPGPSLAKLFEDPGQIGWQWTDDVDTFPRSPGGRRPNGPNANTRGLPLPARTSGRQRWESRSRRGVPTWWVRPDSSVTLSNVIMSPRRSSMR